MGHYLAGDACYPGTIWGRSEARNHIRERLGEGVHPAEIDLLVVPCPGHDGCCRREKEGQR